MLCLGILMCAVACSGSHLSFSLPFGVSMSKQGEVGTGETGYYFVTICCNPSGP